MNICCIKRTGTLNFSTKFTMKVSQISLTDHNITQYCFSTIDQFSNKITILMCICSMYKHIFVYETTQDNFWSSCMYLSHILYTHYRLHSTLAMCSIFIHNIYLGCVVDLLQYVHRIIVNASQSVLRYWFNAIIK